MVDTDYRNAWCKHRISAYLDIAHDEASKADEGIGASNQVWADVGGSMNPCERINMVPSVPPAPPSHSRIANPSIKLATTNPITK
jgi:hypothetical protein